MISSRCVARVSQAARPLSKDDSDATHTSRINIFGSFDTAEDATWYPMTIETFPITIGRDRFRRPSIVRMTLGRL